MIWIVILVLVFVCIVSAIIYSNHSMKVKWEEATNVDVRLVRETMEHVRTASNLDNAMLALMECVNAKRTIEVMLRRYTPQQVKEITGQDLNVALNIINEQQDKIFQDALDKHPELIPKGEWLTYMKMVKERNQSRDSGVAHLDADEMPY